MKTNASFLHHLAASAALLLTAAIQSASAQTTATTDPVGFITLSIPGGGSFASPKVSLLSPTLTQPISWQGAITGIATSTISILGVPTPVTTITVSGTPWTSGQFEGANGSHYVEIVTVSPNTHVTGSLAVVNATTTSTIRVIGNLTSPNVFAAIGDSIKVRKDMTIASLFGATNSAGLLASDDPTTADEVLIYDGASQNSFFYYTGDAFGNPAGWYDAAFTILNGTAGNVPIGPHQGIVIKRKAPAALPFTTNGAVKTGDTLFPVVPGVNVLGTVSAKGLTLDTSALFTGDPATGVKPSDDPTTADEVLIYSNSQATSYFYYNGGAGYLSGWYDSGFSTLTPVGATVTILPGSAFVLKRKFGAAFNWSLPSPTSF